MPPRHPPAEPAVHLVGDTFKIASLAITHPEAAALARKLGADALTDLVRRALPVGILALTLGRAGADTGAIQRTLDVFASQVDAASSAALGELERATTALRAGEADLATRAARVLERLPERVEAALAGEAANVRAQVGAAAAEVQAAGLAEMRTAMAAHAEIVRTAVSLDTQGGPIRALREEVLRMVDMSRQELGGQLAAVHVLLTAAQASTAAVANVRTTRQYGASFEAESMLMARQAVLAAGDVFDETGSRAAPGGGTSRVGDGLATVCGAGRTVRVVMEAKASPKGLTSVKWREELTASRDLREASGGLGIVPDASAVPGGGLFAKVGDRLYVCVADPQILGLVFLALRELCVLAGDRRGPSDTIQAESRISQALTALNELDLVTRHGNAATKSLEKILEVTADIKARAGDALRESLGALGSR